MKRFTQDEVVAGLRAALEAGADGASARIQRLKQMAAEGDGRPVREECGGAMAVIKLDGRSSLARQIRKADETGVTISPMRSTRFRGYQAIHAHPAVQHDPEVEGQNRSIREESARAIAESLEASFDVRAFPLTWTD